ncbi:uncharacterized protein LOC124842755 [Vigna umbellata]|uniref:uncharacterized protein LOC124842755 n=1 Tax=Vigna umbellata TaxID=87088 RepID=UPI001F5F7DE1|nr:uncharacterized protein LOC124842755 [Vigna umbellata]
MVFDVSLHHMGKFMKNNRLQYVRGEIHVIKGIDPNRWSYFEAVRFVKEFKYDIEFKLWWKGLKQKLMSNLRILSNDSEAMLLANYAEENNDVVEIYVQHVPSEAVEVKFLSFGEEADEVDIQEMEEEVNMGDEEEVIVDEQDANVGEQDANVDEEDVYVGEEDGYVDEEDACVGEQDDVVDEEDAYVGGVEGNVEVEDVLMDDQEEEGNA